MSDAQHLPLDARWLRERARNEPSRLNAETMRAMADRIERVAATLAGLRENKLVAVPREQTEAMRRAIWLAQFRHANERSQHPQPDEDCALLAEQRVQSETQRAQDDAAYAAMIAAAQDRTP